MKPFYTALSYIKLARIHRPYAILILMFPAWWGIALASPSIPSPELLFLFALGAFLTRSAGCVYNDIIDRKIDPHVTRTASRPLAAGEVSLRGAWIGFSLFLAGSAGVLFKLPSPAILTGFIALGLILLYPWMKRITYWPQLFLGVTYNMGLLMGWLSLVPTLTLPPLLFYGGAILWTLGYDTIYALQDREEDLRIGVKSSTLVVFPFLKLFLVLIYGGALVFWGVGGELLRLGVPYWLSWTAVACHFTWQIFSLDAKKDQNCLNRFNANALVGGLLFVGILLAR